MLKFITYNKALKLKVLLVLVLMLNSFISFSQNQKNDSINKFIFLIDITFNDLSKGEATITIIVDSIQIKKYKSTEKSQFKIDLDPFHYYHIVISRDGYFAKQIEIDLTTIPLGREKFPFNTIHNDLVLYKELALFKDLFLGTKVKFFFDSKSGIIDFDKQSLEQILVQNKKYEDLLNIIESKPVVAEQLNYFYEKNLITTKQIEEEKYQNKLNIQEIKFKEEELRHQQEEIKRKQLELELLAKDKAVSQLTIKAKEAELLKNMLLANEKKKEIERLNQQKLIDELSIKNKENEIAQKNIEAENKQKQIQGLQKEKELSNENLKQQKFIQKLMIAGSGLLAVFLVFVFFSLAKSRKANKVIAAQKTEVEKQKVIAEEQKEIAESQKHLIEEKQHEIIESITYAKRLQEAILPSQAFINSVTPNNFILYKSKDIVAGDFYWAEKINDLFFIAAADSTGHGVPGAMVSVVCSNALNRSVKEFNLTETGKILDKTRELVVETFTKSNAEVKDGMDISMLCIDKQSQKIYWSGANNPLWYVQQNELHEIKADKQPIGKTDNPTAFTTHQIEYQANTTFYLFTDGFADQFGGPKGKKFKYKQFEELLVSINHKTMQEQANILTEKFDNWKGSLEQVDDVCVIGVRV